MTVKSISPVELPKQSTLVIISLTVKLVNCPSETKMDRFSIQLLASIKFKL